MDFMKLNGYFSLNDTKINSVIKIRSSYFLNRSNNYKRR